MKDNARDQSQVLPNRRRLWSGWFLAVFAWILHLSVSYGLVEWFCRNRAALSEAWLAVLLHGTTIATLGLALFGAWLAWNNYRTLVRLPAAEAGPATKRSLFMAQSGIWTSLFFAVLIAVEGIPNLMVPPCL